MTPSLAALELVAETVLILALVLAVLFFFRRISAATEHGLLSAAVIAVLVVTVVSPFVPARHLGLVPIADGTARRGLVANPLGEAPAVTPAMPAAERAVIGTQSPAPASPAGRTIAGSLGTVWLTGSALVFLWVLGGLVYGWRLRRLTRPAGSTHLADRFRWALERVGLRTTIPLVESERLKIPVVFGWVRPVVILPAHAGTWEDDRLRAVLLHETAHIRRRDLAFQFLAKLTCAVYWFNPLVWVVERRLLLAGERAADDQVIRRDVSPAEYAEHLMETSAELGVERTPLWATAAMAEGTAFKDRILSILDPNVRRGEPTMSDRAVVTLFAVAAIFALVAFSPWRAMSSTIERPGDALVDAAPASRGAVAAARQDTTGDLGTLIRMLGMQDASMREHAASALGELGDPRAVAPLMDVVLRDPVADVREHAASALGELGDPRARAALAQAAQADANASVREHAASALGQLGGRAAPAEQDAFDAVPSLIDAVLNDGDASVREHAATALGESRDGRGYEPLVDAALHDGAAPVREHATIALGQLGDGRAFDVLLAIMHGTDVEDVRVHGAYALGLLGDARALEPLLAALQDDSPRMRANAAQGLGELGDARALDMLRQARRDPDAAVRQWAQEAIDRIRRRP